MQTREPSQQTLLEKRSLKDKKDSQNKTVKEEELAEESAASLRLTLVSFLLLLALLSFLLLLFLVVAWFL